MEQVFQRRYSGFRMYPDREFVEGIYQQTPLCADLSNAFLTRYEDIQRRTRARPVKDRSDLPLFIRVDPVWVSHQMTKTFPKQPIDVPMQPGPDGKPAIYSYEVMTAEITRMRHDDQKWRAIPVGTARRVARSFADSIAAYFRRLKELANPAVYAERAAAFEAKRGRKPTKHELAGYPRFKSPGKANWLPGMFASGWTLTKDDTPQPEWVREGPDPAHGRMVKTGRLVPNPKFWWLTINGIPGRCHCRGELPSGPPDVDQRDQTQRAVELPGPPGFHIAGQASRLFQYNSITGPPGDEQRELINRLTDGDISWNVGKWMLSVGCEMPARLRGERARLDNQADLARTPTTVEFDLTGCTARVNGVPQVFPGWTRIEALSEVYAENRSSHDTFWPRGKRVKTHEEHVERRESARALSRLSAFIARARRDSLHVWTTAIVNRASALTIIMPEVKKVTATPRGSKKSWGGAVKEVSAQNRHVLSMAPSMAVAMMAYKALEAGFMAFAERVTEHATGIGRELVALAKKERRVRHRHKQVKELLESV